MINRRELEIYEKNKTLKQAKAEKKGGMTIKDWITTTVACLAVGISVTTAYFNLLRQTNVVRVVVDNRSPWVAIERDGSHFLVTANHDVTFINSGNQTAAVSRIILVLLQPTSFEEFPANCKDDTERATPYKEDPFVIDPGKIVRKRIELPVEDMTDGAVLFETVGDQEAERFVLTCLRFEIITPGKTYADIRMPLHIHNFQRQKGTNRWIWVTGRFVTEPSQTITLLQETRTAFSPAK
jgi:hypothetical protein